MRGQTEPTWNISAAPKSAVIAVSNTQESVKMRLQIFPHWQPGAGISLDQGRDCSRSITPGLWQRDSLQGEEHSPSADLLPSIYTSLISQTSAFLGVNNTHPLQGYPRGRRCPTPGDKSQSCHPLQPRKELIQPGCSIKPQHKTSMQPSPKPVGLPCQNVRVGAAAPSKPDFAAAATKDAKPQCSDAIQLDNVSSNKLSAFPGPVLSGM